MIFLGAVHACLRTVFKSGTQLHPPEVSLLLGKQDAMEILEEAGFSCAGYRYGIRDAFIQAELVGRRTS